jgi:hypothetical protein
MFSSLRTARVKREENFFSSLSQPTKGALFFSARKKKKNFSFGNFFFFSRAKKNLLLKTMNEGMIKDFFFLAN